MKTKQILKIIIVMALVILLVSTGATAAVLTTTLHKNSTIEGSRSVVLLSEGFEDNQMPPTGWTHTAYNGAYTWKIVADEVHTGTYAAQCPRTNQEQNEWLITPEIDLTDYLGGSLDFWCNGNLTTAPGMSVDVVVQGDGINDIIWSITSETDWTTYAWRNKVLDLDAYAEEVITIGWHYYGGAGKKNFGLDDVIVYGEPKTPPPILNITKIKGGIMRISAQIQNQNNETGDDALNVTWSINATGNGIFQKKEFYTNGTFPKIDHNGGIATGILTKQTERDHKWIVGVAKLTIVVTADIPDNPRVDAVNRTVIGYLLLIFVYIPQNQFL